MRPITTAIDDAISRFAAARGIVRDAVATNALRAPQEVVFAELWERRKRLGSE